MIVKIQKRGKSFAGLATYLTRDPKKATEERVDWTHTLNLAHDHAPSAVDEMLWTFKAADLLKQEAGIRGGGRTTESPVKHFSLNWSPDDDPTREHMIETTVDFLRHMKWHDHQALLVAHTDKPYAHVHVMLNAVHPETGLALNEDFDQRRAQAWALEYEKANGRIYCEQRLSDVNEREDAPTRPAWLAFKEKQAEFIDLEKAREDSSANAEDDQEKGDYPRNSDWKRLKEIQRHEREAFFAEGKLYFSEMRQAIYGGVRDEFRDQWADYYAATKDGTDSTILAEMKASLVAEQKDRLAERRDDACGDLKSFRDVQYRELLDDQRDIRHQMLARQEAGLDNALFLQLVSERDAGKDREIPTFREAAEEIVRRPERTPFIDAPSITGTPHNPAHMKAEVDIGANIATGLGFGLLSFMGSIADGITGSSPAPQPRQKEPEPQGTFNFNEAAIAAGRERQRNEQEEADRDWRKRQRGHGE